MAQNSVNRINTIVFVNIFTAFRFHVKTTHKIQWITRIADVHPLSIHSLYCFLFRRNGYKTTHCKCWKPGKQTISQNRFSFTRLKSENRNNISLRRRLQCSLLQHTLLQATFHRRNVFATEIHANDKRLIEPTTDWMLTLYFHLI